MTTKKHTKHAQLQKPKGGRFHQNEIAILGAPCHIIQDLVEKITIPLSQRMRVSFVDADHSESENENSVFFEKYTDKISFHRLDFNADIIEFRYRQLFNHSDLVLVNGNHFKAKKQIVIINEKKKESLSRKLDRLTDVGLILLDKGMSGVFPFIKEHLQDEVPEILQISEKEKIAQWIEENVTIPGIKGLVFAGGKSIRMGRDKGAIDYFGKPQREYAADILSGVSSEVFLSVRPGMNISSDYRLIEDRFTGLGPYGGLLSAFMHDPNSAWLAVSCDVPLVDQSAIDRLIKERNPSKVATCYHNPETGFPEPLITLWEPRAYPVLLNFLSMGYSCPRKALINSEIEEIQSDRPEILTNVNTPEDLEKVKAVL